MKTRVDFPEDFRADSFHDRSIAIWIEMDDGHARI